MSVSSLESKSGLDISIKNVTGFIQDKFPNIDIEDIPGLNPNDPPGTSANFAVFMFSLIFGMFWITYITFFNSRVVGAIVTKIANSFVKDGYIRVRTLIRFTIFISFSSRNQIDCAHRLLFYVNLKHYVF